MFGNILDLRECSRHLLEALDVQQREQDETISKIGDIFLNAATKFRSPYLGYIRQVPGVEKRLKEAMENDPFFITWYPRHPDNAGEMKLKDWLNRPSEHLHEFLAFIEAIRMVTLEENPDVNSLEVAAEVIRGLQLMTFQAGMGKGPTERFEWHNLVSEDVRDGIEQQEAKRQT